MWLFFVHADRGAGNDLAGAVTLHLPGSQRTELVDSGDGGILAAFTSKHPDELVVTKILARWA